MLPSFHFDAQKLTGFQYTKFQSPEMNSLGKRQIKSCARFFIGQHNTHNNSDQ